MLLFIYVQTLPQFPPHSPMFACSLNLSPQEKERMFSDSCFFRFLEAIFEDNSLDSAVGAFADDSLDLLDDANRNLQADDFVRMLRRNTPKKGRDLYEFIAFLTWYGSLLICCIIPAICAYRRRRRAMIELEEQILRSTSGRNLPSYYVNSQGQWAQLRRGTIQSSNEPLLLMNASTLDGRDITIMATRGNVRRLMAIHEERNGKERMGKVAQLTKHTTMVRCICICICICNCNCI